MFGTLPVLMALSWVPVTNTAPPPAPATAAQNAQPSAQAANTITCPINGQEIPSCCCPVKK